MRAQHPGTALGRQTNGILGSEPILRRTALDARQIAGKTHRFEHVLAVSRCGAVRADPDIDAVVEQRSHVGNARAEPEVRTRVVGDRSATVADQPHIVFVEPDAMRAAKSFVDEAECGEVRSDRTCVAPLRRSGLYP